MLAFHLSIYIIFFFSSTNKILGSICLLICVHVLKLLSVDSRMQQGENRLLSCLSLPALYVKDWYR